MTGHNLQKAKNPFGDDAVPAAATDAIAVSQAQAQVQGAVVMAKKFPRDQRASAQRILDACSRVELAQDALYAYPRGGETIQGPSIRLAEVAAQNWGNMDFGLIELSQEGGKSQVMAYAWDLETNVRSQKVFVTGHVRDTRSGRKILTDQRDVYEHVANQGARRVRACIMAIIPKDVMDAAVKQVHLTLENTMGAPEDELARMVKAFGEYGVSEQQIQKRLGKSFKAVTQSEVLRMRQIYASIRDEMSKPEDWFDPPDPPKKAKADEAREKMVGGE